VAWRATRKAFDSVAFGVFAVATRIARATHAFCGGTARGVARRLLIPDGLFGLVCDTRSA